MSLLILSLQQFVVLDIIAILIRASDFEKLTEWFKVTQNVGRGLPWTQFCLTLSLQAGFSWGLLWTQDPDTGGPVTGPCSFRKPKSSVRVGSHLYRAAPPAPQQHVVGKDAHSHTHAEGPGK